MYYLCIRNQNSLIMETREYFEKVMQDYYQNRKGRSLRKYCKDEAVDYDWLFWRLYRRYTHPSDGGGARLHVPNPM